MVAQATNCVTRVGFLKSLEKRKDRGWVPGQDARHSTIFASRYLPRRILAANLDRIWLLRL